MRILIGIAIGGTLAMMFPEQASDAYEFVRGLINSAAGSVAEATSEPTNLDRINSLIEEMN
jgi:hypothetical protein